MLKESPMYYIMTYGWIIVALMILIGVTAFFSYMAGYNDNGEWSCSCKCQDCEQMCYSKYQNETAAYLAGIFYCANATMGGNLTYG